MLIAEARTGFGLKSKDLFLVFRPVGVNCYDVSYGVQATAPVT